jgi:hypothetical protein
LSAPAVGTTAVAAAPLAISSLAFRVFSCDLEFGRVHDRLRLLQLLVVGHLFGKLVL